MADESDGTEERGAESAVSPGAASVDGNVGSEAEADTPSCSTGTFVSALELAPVSVTAEGSDGTDEGGAESVVSLDAASVDGNVGSEAEADTPSCSTGTFVSALELAPVAVTADGSDGMDEAGAESAASIGVASMADDIGSEVVADAPSCSTGAFGCVGSEASISELAGAVTIEASDGAIG